MISCSWISQIDRNKGTGSSSSIFKSITAHFSVELVKFVNKRWEYISFAGFARLFSILKYQTSSRHRHHTEKVVKLVVIMMSTNQCKLK